MIDFSTGPPFTFTGPNRARENNPQKELLKTSRSRPGLGEDDGGGIAEHLNPVECYGPLVSPREPRFSKRNGVNQERESDSLVGGAIGDHNFTRTRVGGITGRGDGVGGTDHSVLKMRWNWSCSPEECR